MNHIDDVIEAARAVAAETGTPLTPEEERRMVEAVRAGMPQPCPCDICVDRRREPFLAPCFELGARWTSLDSGSTWDRFPTAREMDDRARRAAVAAGTVFHLTAIAINADRGEVTFAVSRPARAIDQVDVDRGNAAFGAKGRL